MGSVLVRLNGRDVLFRQGEMSFTAPSEIGVAEHKRGGEGLPRLSGTIAVAEGVTLVFGE